MKLFIWMQEQKLKGRDLAIMTKISETKISLYKNGHRIPTDSDMKTIFNVSQGKVSANDFHNMHPTTNKSSIHTVKTNVT